MPKDKISVRKNKILFDLVIRKKIRFQLEVKKLMVGQKEHFGKTPLQKCTLKSEKYVLKIYLLSKYNTIIIKKNVMDIFSNVFR